MTREPLVIPSDAQSVPDAALSWTHNRIYASLRGCLWLESMLTAMTPVTDPSDRVSDYTDCSRALIAIVCAVTAYWQYYGALGSRY